MFTAPVEALYTVLALALSAVLRMVPPFMVSRAAVAVPELAMKTVPWVVVTLAEVMTVSAPEMVITPVLVLLTATPIVGVPSAVITPTVFICYKSSGVNPVCFATFASIFGPISSLS